MDVQPSNKTLATFGGAMGGGALVVWIVEQFGRDMPADVGVAVASIIALIVAYFMPAKSGKYVHTEPVVPESELIEDTGPTNGESDFDDPPQDTEYDGAEDEEEVV